MAAASKKLTVEFVYSKTTKNTVAYEELPEKTHVGGLYLQKTSLAALGLTGVDGEKISVAIEKI